MEVLIHIRQFELTHSKYWTYSKVINRWYVKYILIWMIFRKIVRIFLFDIFIFQYFLRSCVGNLYVLSTHLLSPRVNNHFYSNPSHINVPYKLGNINPLLINYQEGKDMVMWSRICFNEKIKLLVKRQKTLVLEWRCTCLTVNVWLLLFFKILISNMKHLEDSVYCLDNKQTFIVQMSQRYKWYM